MVKVVEGKDPCLAFTSALGAVRKPFNFSENKPAPKYPPGVRG